MLSPEFSARTCFNFQDVRWKLPMVAVHGDAHLGQFVVTEKTYGLEDFDQSGFGPSIVDLVRYASSIHIACRETAWACNSDAIVDLYFRSYREGLHAPVERSVPAVVARLRAVSPSERSTWLEWASTLMLPLDAKIESVVREGWGQLVADMLEARPDRPASFYEIVALGELKMGFGSALEQKALLRVRGDTDDPNDDVIIEGRAVVPPRGDECAWRPQHGGTLTALMFMSTLGSRMPDVFGVAPMHADPIAAEAWVQSWDPGYIELSITDVQSQAEMEELARDAAYQLSGHFWTTFPEPLRVQQSLAQLKAFDLVRERAIALSKQLADEVVREWERFRAE
jgi:hypothetical protein